MTGKTTAPQQEENPLQTLAKGVAAVIDGSFVEVKKALSLPDSSDDDLVKARNEAIGVAAQAIEHAYVLGLHGGHAAGSAMAQKAVGDGDLEKATQLAFILDGIEQLANDVVLKSLDGSSNTDLAKSLIAWRSDGLALLQAVSAQENTELAKSACKDKKAKKDDEESTEGEDNAEEEDAEKSIFLGPLAKFNAILAAIDVAAEASAEGCLAKSLSPTPFTKLSMATAAFAESLNALPPEVAVEFTKGVGTILEADLLGKAQSNTIDPATLKTLQKHAAAILDLSRSELAKSEPKVVESMDDPAARAARLAKLNK